MGFALRAAWISNLGPVLNEFFFTSSLDKQLGTGFGCVLFNWRKVGMVIPFLKIKKEDDWPPSLFLTISF